MAGNILSLLPPLATRAPRVAGWLLATAQAAWAGPVEAAVVGPDGPDKEGLHRALMRSPHPGLVVALQAGTGASRVPLMEGRTAAQDGSPLVYLCRDMVCERPVGTLPELQERLAAMRPGG